VCIAALALGIALGGSDVGLCGSILDDTISIDIISNDSVAGYCVDIAFASGSNHFNLQFAI